MKIPSFNSKSNSSAALPELLSDISFDFLPESEASGEAPAPVGRSKKRWLWAALLLLVVFGAVILHLKNRGATPVDVKTATVARQTVRSLVTSTGTLEAFTTVDVKSRASGTILQMAVEEGSRVKRGQLLAVIDRQDTSVAYRQAVADVDAARAQLQQAQSNAQKDAQNLGPQLHQSREGIAAAQAKLGQARQNLELERETVPADLETARQSVISAGAKLAQSRQALEIESRTRQAALVEATQSLAAAKVRLYQAQKQAQTQPRLSSASIESAQANASAATASLQNATQTLAQLQNATQPQEAAQVQAQVAEARSNLETQTANLTRQQALLQQGFVAQSVADDAQNRVESARASLQTAQSRLDTLEAKQGAERRAAQAQVDNARGVLAAAQANLETARANRVQDDLKRGDFGSAQASVRQSEAALETARANLRQIAVRRGDVQNAQSALAQSGAALQSARANTHQIGVREADVQNALATLRQSQAALQSTQTNRLGVEAREREVENANAKLERAQITAQNARQNLEQTRVLAPRDGIVLKKYVDVGAIIQSGQSGFSGGTSIVQLAQIDRMFVDVSVDEADISQIRLGQSVSIQLDAFPGAHKVGTVRKIFPEAQEDQSVTYIHVQVAIAPREVDAKLRPNMNATCEFLVNEVSGALAVPSQAVREEDGATFVTVIKDPLRPLYDPNNQQKRAVKVGVRGDENYQITGGLSQGEVVVTQIIAPPVAKSSFPPPR